MRWSCPHCGTQLSLAEEKISTGWSFARCYRCGGFALIRRAELSVIRVDKAPAGETVLLPEATADPRQGLSAVAAENYARAVSPPATPVVRPAALRSGDPATKSSAPFGVQISAAATPPSEPARLPTPLPEITTIVTPLSERKSFDWDARLIYAGIGFAALATLGSGAYLLSSGRSLVSSLIGIRNPAAESRREVALAPASSSREDVIPVATAGTLASAPEVTDELHHRAMAPTRVPETPALSVRPNHGSVALYAGPGPQFALLGWADPALSYPVNGWNDRWFKLELDDHACAAINEYNRRADPHRAPLAAGAVAWVRNDLVNSVPSR